MPRWYLSALRDVRRNVREKVDMIPPQLPGSVWESNTGRLEANTVEMEVVGVGKLPAYFLSS
jgi:hypothetical protein